MANNIIKFPSKKTETVEIEDDHTLNKKALEFAYEMIDYVHDGIHEETGDCIFTDDDYVPMVICMAEVISATYLLSQVAIIHFRKSQKICLVMLISKVKWIIMRPKILMNHLMRMNNRAYTYGL